MIVLKLYGAGAWMNQPIKKVAIVGGSSSREEAPIMDESWEVWGLGAKRHSLPRATRWFEIHSIPQLKRHYSKKNKRGCENHLNFLASLDCPVYMQKPHPQVPNSVAYPLAKVLKECGRCFTSSISYMIGLAIYERFEGIGIWGVQMVSKKEYIHQWAAVRYLLALAKQRGIGVYLHPQCPIPIPDKPELPYTDVLYGYHWNHPKAWWNNITDKEREEKLSPEMIEAIRDGKLPSIEEVAGG